MPGLDLLPHDQFGGSIAGAVTLCRHGGTVPPTPNYEPLSECQLEAKIKQAIDDSDQGVPDDSRATPTGYQPQALARQMRLFDEHYGHLLSRNLSLSQYRSEIRTSGMTT